MSSVQLPVLTLLVTVPGEFSSVNRINSTYLSLYQVSSVQLPVLTLLVTVPGEFSSVNRINPVPVSVLFKRKKNYTTSNVLLTSTFRPPSAA